MKKKQKRLRAGSWGPVRVIRGPLKGKVGYYDDDGDGPGEAIVYFGEVLTGPYHVLRRSDLDPIDVALANTARFIRQQPVIARLVGVRPKRRKYVARRLHGRPRNGTDRHADDALRKLTHPVNPR